MFGGKMGGSDSILVFEWGADLERPKPVDKLRDHMLSGEPVDFNIMGTMYSCYIVCHEVSMYPGMCNDKFTVKLFPK